MMPDSTRDSLLQQELATLRAANQVLQAQVAALITEVAQLKQHNHILQPCFFSPKTGE
jgi:cell division protein FtsB